VQSLKRFISAPKKIPEEPFTGQNLWQKKTPTLKRTDSGSDRTLVEKNAPYEITGWDSGDRTGEIGSDSVDGKISGEREGFMDTGLSMGAPANKVSRTKSMRFLGRGPTGPSPHLNFVACWTYMIRPLICLPCMHAYDARIASNS
jgi:hypothetical protein